MKFGTQQQIGKSITVTWPTIMFFFLNSWWRTTAVRSVVSELCY